MVRRAYQGGCRARPFRLRIELLERRAMLAADVLSAEGWGAVESLADVTGASAPPPLESLASQARDLVSGPHQQRVEIASSQVGDQPPAEAAAGFQTVIDNGPSSNRVDLVILGDGYTAPEIDTTYIGHVDEMLAYLFNAGQDPFPRYAKFFNSHRINVVSNESGADKAPEGVLVDTALDARYYCNGIERLLCISSGKANTVKSAALAGAGFNSEMEFVTVNDTKYGGSGGQYAVFAGGNSSANELALHEVAHSFNRLADEYYSPGQYTGSEPSEVNVTTDPGGAKWQDWLEYNQPGIGAIGAYEGARYFAEGLYRPSFNSKMRSLGRPFDAVSREKIILDIYDLVDPMDQWSDNSVVVQNPDPTVWVEVVDTDVVNVQWSVDDVDVPGATDESFNLRDFGYGEGVYSVAARAFDPTDWVRRDLAKLEQSVQWTVAVEPVLAPGVQSVAINNRDVSRSSVTSVTVTFDSEVDHEALQSAFTVQNVTSLMDVGIVNVASTDVGGQTISELTFSGVSTITPELTGSLSNTLVNGNYLLDISSAQVRSAVDGSVAMASDFQFGGHVAGEANNDNFFRWYGDADGDGHTNYGDFASAFLPAFGSGLGTNSEYRSDLDIDGDGFINFSDFSMGFLPAFGSSRP